MEQIIKSYPGINQNLQYDLDLLNLCNEEGKGPYLRFWEQPDYCVILGKSRKAAIDVHLDRCEQDGIAICRRESGGGTVITGPGCLCYTLVFPVSQNTALFDIGHTNRYVMSRHQKALQEMLGKRIEIQGITDLTIDGKKFSGNAQKRKSKAVLFHGTFLLNFDFGKITDYLRIPPDTPEYRQNKPHIQFLTNINIQREMLIDMITQSWNK